jgi:hypothetical protein
MVHDGAAPARAEVHLAAGDHLRCAEAAGRLDVSDVREAFRAQERFGDIERGEADRRRERQADRGRLRRALGGQRCAQAEDARGRARRQPGQEIAAIL